MSYKSREKRKVFQMLGYLDYHDDLINYSLHYDVADSVSEIVSYRF